MSKESIHWSFWVIGLAGLIWNIMGGINFSMQMNPEMLAEYPADARLLVEGRPAWATGAFAIAVFGGVFANLLLLFKRSVSLYVFIAALLGVLVTNIHTLGVTDSTSILSGSLMSFIVATFFIWYAKNALGKGWIN